MSLVRWTKINSRQAEEQSLQAVSILRIPALHVVSKGLNVYHLRGLKAFIYEGPDLGFKTPCSSCG